jgi:xanthine dehydrogenase accessory factor
VLSRLHSPIGLDLQAVTPAEVAVSITAQIIAARNPAATGLPLSACSGPIHAGTATAGTARAAASIPVDSAAPADLTLIRA